jgi:hypothetical protein
MNDSIYVTFWKRQNCRNRGKISLPMVEDERGNWLQMDRMRKLGGVDRNVLYHDCGGGWMAMCLLGKKP